MIRGSIEESPALVAGFPVMIPVGPFALHPHLLFELLAYALGFAAYRRARARQGDVLALHQRWTVIVAAAVGAAVGSKLLGWLNDPVRTWQMAVDHPLTLMGPKTIVGGLLGGWFAVEWIKRRQKITSRTGDLFAIPLCLAIAIGRIGCFLTGLDDHTFGTPTALPWGVDFGDGLARHPTQLYEIVFCLALAAALRRVTQPLGHRFRVFIVAYLTWRLAVDFIKPDQALAGMSGIQWACLATLLWLALRRAPPPSARS